MTASPASQGRGNGLATDTSIDTLSFDELLAKLEDVVQQLESDELTLDASIDTFERGVGLAARCQQLLGDAELRISQITDEIGETAPFAALDADAGEDEL